MYVRTCLCARPCEREVKCTCEIIVSIMMLSEINNKQTKHMLFIETIIVYHVSVAKSFYKHTCTYVVSK